MSNDFHDKAWSLILRVMVPITLAYIGWSAANVIQNQKDIAVLSVQQFTAQDAQQLERRMDARYEVIQQQIGTIRTDVAVIRQILESQKEDR